MKQNQGWAYKPARRDELLSVVLIWLLEDSCPDLSTCWIHKYPSSGPTRTKEWLVHKYSCCSSIDSLKLTGASQAWFWVKERSNSAVIFLAIPYFV